MTRDFHIFKYRVHIVCEYAPDDFGFSYICTGKLVRAIGGQFGPFYYFFGVATK